MDKHCLQTYVEVMKKRGYFYHKENGFHYIMSPDGEVVIIGFSTKVPILRLWELAAKVLVEKVDGF